MCILFSSRKSMRLEDNYKSLIRKLLSSCLNCCPHFSWVVSIVIDNINIAKILFGKATLSTLIRKEPLLDIFQRYLLCVSNSNNSCCIQDIMIAKQMNCEFTNHLTVIQNTEGGAFCCSLDVYCLKIIISFKPVSIFRDCCFEFS